MTSHEQIPDYRAFDPSKQRKRLTGAYLVLAGALIGVLAMSWFASNRVPSEGAQTAQDTAFALNTPGMPSNAALAYEDALITAAEKAIPAVVSVYSSGVKPFVPSNPFFRHMYGYYNRRVGGMGSGVIIDSHGTIYTNDHVIDTGNNVTITVVLTDGRQYNANLVKRFKHQDIAILSIDGDDLPYIEIAPSQQVRPGQTVLAIGNPFGAGLTEGLTGGDPTVTRGIISATDRVLFAPSREGEENRYYQHLLQTDASINDGNSGGALVDIHGRLIAINTAIFDKGGGSLGIGFAIPTDRIKLFLDQEAKYGDIDRWETGIQIQQLTPNIADALGYHGVGALVNTVDQGSAGDASDIKRGDIIVGINGYNVRTTEHVQNMFSGFVTGETLMLTVIRAGERLELPITLEPRD
jgi:serine protease DegQ